MVYRRNRDLEATNRAKHAQHMAALRASTGADPLPLFAPPASMPALPTSQAAATVAQSAWPALDAPEGGPPKKSCDSSVGGGVSPLALGGAASASVLHKQQEAPAKAPAQPQVCGCVCYMCGCVLYVWLCVLHMWLCVLYVRLYVLCVWLCVLCVWLCVLCLQRPPTLPHKRPEALARAPAQPQVCGCVLYVHSAAILISSRRHQQEPLLSLRCVVVFVFYS
jgi:hypothetical protein